MATSCTVSGSWTTPSRLSALLQDRWPEHSTGSDPGSDELETVLLDIIDSAQRACPTFRLCPEVFVSYLRPRLPAAVPPPRALRQMHTSDLYLACACSYGDVQAFAAFDDRCLAPLDRVLGKMGIAPDVAADVKQDIRVRVLLGDGRRAEIVNFSGRGDLRGWVRVMAVRQALRRQVRVRRDVAVEDDDLGLLVPLGDPGLDHVKQVYRDEFKRAFDSALRALPDHERNVLRQHHVDGLTIDQIAALYRVHRSTAARLLVRARALVLEATRARLMVQLGVRSQELDSIMRMIESQLEISLRGLSRGKR